MLDTLLAYASTKNITVEVMTISNSHLESSLAYLKKRHIRLIQEPISYYPASSAENRDALILAHELGHIISNTINEVEAWRQAEKILVELNLFSILEADFYKVKKGCLDTYLHKYSSEEEYEAQFKPKVIYEEEYNLDDFPDIEF